LRQNLQNESNCSEGSEKKRRKVVSQKEKLLAHTFRGREERLQILKRMTEKTEEGESHNPVFTFFKSMAQTVTQFPPSITAETRVKICQLVAQMEAKALHKQNQARASSFLFHGFSCSTFDYQVPCYSCHGNVPTTRKQNDSKLITQFNEILPPIWQKESR